MNAIDRNSKRTELVRRVREGLSPVEAQLEADAAGIGSLLPAPPKPEAYDPTRLLLWSLLMAVTWVAFRRIEVVRHSWNPYVTAHFQWVPLPGKGHELRRKRPVGLHTVQASVWDDELLEFHGPDASFAKGLQQLLFAIANGSVIAKGRDMRKGPHSNVEVISVDDWSALVLGDQKPQYGLPGEAGAEILHFRGDPQPIYVDIVIDQRSLREAFPDGETTPSPPPPSQRQSVPSTMSGPRAVPPPMEIVARTPSAERAAVTAFIKTEHNGEWPKLSDQKLAAAAKTWVESSPERRKEFPIFKLSKKVVLGHPDRPKRQKGVGSA